MGELLALEATHSIDSLVCAFDTAIHRRIERYGIRSLTNAEQTVVAIEGLEREVNNGGYHQFFVNYSVNFAPIIVEALLRIDCPATAAITRDAVDALRLPVLTVEAIEAIICDVDEEHDEALDACDQRFFEYPEPIEDRLFAFIKKNRGEFRFV